MNNQINKDELSRLKALGQRLRQSRLVLNDKQKDFAFRIGISEVTLRKMEQGHSGVAIGNWLKALVFLGREFELDGLLKEELLFTPSTKNRASSKKQ